MPPTPRPRPCTSGRPRTPRPAATTSLATAFRLAVLLAAAWLAAGPVAAQGDAAAPPDDAQAILDAVVDNLRGGGQRATLTLRVERDGDVREYVLETVSDGAERALTRVVAPARDAGQAFLVDGDDLFVYAPRLGRALRLPPSGRSDGFLGSDLSYDDLAGDDIRDTYDARVVDRGEDHVTLSLTPRPSAPTPYGELRFRADLPTLAPAELTYVDQRGDPVKRLTFSDLRDTADGRLVPTRVEVDDLTADGGRTVAVWTDTAFGVEPPDRCFTQQALERGCDW